MKSLDDDRKVREIDPLLDPGWPLLLSNHPDASIFHTREWLTAIQRTYGYKPIAYTTSSEETLTNAVVFCQISSWLTGKRLVSLPFSDHCQPMASARELQSILGHVSRRNTTAKQRYVELRPVRDISIEATRSDFSVSSKFGFHQIDLRPDLPTIYSKFHESCIRRKIKRAERESLVYESGRSEELLQKFRHLLLLTRRRHKLPPQPASWFKNIVECLGDMATIHLVSQSEIPIASIVTLLYKNSLVYKYGCSDSAYNKLGGTPFLFWKAIQQGKEAGAEFFDLGRSGSEDPGLIAFKEHLGGVPSSLTYYRSPVVVKDDTSMASGAASWAREALIRLPDSLLSGVGEAVYRHIG